MRRSERQQCRMRQQLERHLRETRIGDARQHTRRRAQDRRALMATTHDVIAETYYRTFSRTNGVLARLVPGDTVRTRTLCAGGHSSFSACLVNS